MRAVFESDRISGGEAVFNLVDEALLWSPFEIKAFEPAKNLLGIDFYVPYVFMIPFRRRYSFSMVSSTLRL